jgi:sulfatase maturation enzyme AslB (radical SAM superfamily)
LSDEVLAEYVRQYIVVKHGAQLNTLTSVPRKSSEHPLEVYQFLKGIGSEFMQLRLSSHIAHGSWVTPSVDQEAAACAQVIRALLGDRGLYRGRWS